MKVQLMSALGTVSVVAAVAATGAFGCGGTTSALPGADGGGTSSPEGAAAGQEASSTNPPPGTDAGAAAISPAMLGAMLGGSVVDGGEPSFGVTPQVATGCDALCAKEATANCPNQGATSDCALGCRLLLNNSVCATATMSLLTCEGTSTVSCDSTGKATLDDCGAQTLTSAACFLTNANDPTIAAPCTTYCAKLAAAACPNDDPSGCQAGCQVIGGFVAACDPLWKQYVDCADSDAGVITCGSDGKGGASTCVVQALEYAACLYGGVSTTTDAGQ
jgi:hypothetical protein